MYKDIASNAMKVARLLGGLVLILLVFTSPGKVPQSAFVAIDAAAFCFLVNDSLHTKSAMPVIAAVWLAVNNLVRIPRSDPSWLGLFGFAGAVMVAPFVNFPGKSP